MPSFLDILHTPPSPPPPIVPFSDRGIEEQTSDPASSPSSEPGSPGTRASSASPASLVPSRKRRADDLEKYVESLAKHMKMDATGQDEMHNYIKLSDDKKAAWTAARLIAIDKRVSCLEVPESRWEIPKALKKNIHTYAAGVILSPSVTAYVTGTYTRDVVMKLLAANPSWGYTAEVKAATHKHDMVVKQVLDELTEYRHKVKKFIEKGLGLPDTMGPGRINTQDIIAMCQDITKKIHRDSNFVVTIAMCARMAFLRQVLLEYQDNSSDKKGESFWPVADKRLTEIQELCKNDKAQISSIFGRFLTNDRKAYGEVNVHSQLRSAEMTMEQQASENQVALGNERVDTGSGGSGDGDCSAMS